MPTVPQYGGPQVQARALQTPMQGTPDVSSGLMQAGRAFDQIGSVAEKIVERDTADAAFGAHAKLQQDWLAFDADARQKYRGQNADQYKAETDKWWADAPNKYGEGLNVAAKRMAGKAMTQTQLQAQASALGYWNSEKERAADESAIAAKGSEVQFAITTSTPQAITVARQKINGINANMAQRKGWTTEQLQAANVQDVSLMHVSQVNTLMRRDPTAAQTYFDANKGEILPQQQAAISEHLGIVTAANDGQKAAQDIWTAIGPRADGQAVELDKMEAEARKRYENDPARQKAAIADLRERTQAFNAAEGERRAQNTNGAWQIYQQTRSLAAMQKSPAYLALPAGEQVKLSEQVTDRQHMLMVRGVEDANRVEALKTKQSFPAFLQYSDPAVLAGLSRAQVTALQPYIGNQLTDHLANKWESLQKQETKLQASMDQQDFDHIADQLGMKPFAPSKSENEKRQLGELKFKVEQLVDQAQRTNGKALTREDKMNLMRKEMATTVSTSSWMGMSSTETPVISITPDQVAKVKVPDAVRSDLVARLQAGYAKNPRPEYEPTEDNIRKLYLRMKSPAAQFIVPAK